MEGKRGLDIKVYLTIDAEYVYISLCSKDLKTPTESTLLGHISWIRQMMSTGIVHSIQWCGTREMTADGHTKGSIDREGILQVMSGRQAFAHEVKRYSPYRGER